MRLLVVALACLVIRTTDAMATRNDPTASDIPADASPEVRSLIEKTLSDNPVERYEGVRELRKFGPAAAPAIPFLIRVWLGGSSPDIDASHTLEEIGDAAVEPCLAAMRGTSGQNRIFVIHGLGQWKNPRMLDAVANILRHDPDPKSREAAAWSLTHCANPRVVLPLISAFKDPDARV